jgi:hypothetical protein
VRKKIVYEINIINSVTAKKESLQRFFPGILPGTDIKQ